jgi:hypothetical protein
VRVEHALELGAQALARIRAPARDLVEHHLDPGLVVAQPAEEEEQVDRPAAGVAQLLRQAARATASQVWGPGGG